MDNTTRSYFSKRWQKLLKITKVPPDVPVLLQNHPFVEKFSRQVGLDVERSLWNFATISNPRALISRQNLGNIILATLSNDLPLHYYQGFHEVAETVLLTTNNPALCYTIMCKISSYHLRHFLLPEFDVTIQYLSFVSNFLWSLDPQLAKFLESSNHEPPLFTVSWVLTWFSHVIESLKVRQNMIDFFLVSHPLAPAVVSALVIKRKRKILLSMDPDFTQVHALFTKLDDTVPWTNLIDQASEILEDRTMLTQMIDETNISAELRRCLKSFPYSYNSEVVDISQSKLDDSSNNQVTFISTVLSALLIGGLSTAAILLNKSS
ncbi:hypothetical protein RCL1_002244 [Eukaryota sp. TZLM3-RCL]